VVTRDEASVVRVFPDGESRTRRTPRVEHLGVGTRFWPDPFEEVEDQRLDGAGSSGWCVPDRLGQCVGFVLHVLTVDQACGSWTSSASYGVSPEASSNAEVGSHQVDAGSRGMGASYRKRRRPRLYQFKQVAVAFELRQVSIARYPGKVRSTVRFPRTARGGSRYLLRRLPRRRPAPGG